MQENTIAAGYTAIEERGGTGGKRGHNSSSTEIKSRDAREARPLLRCVLGEDVDQGGHGSLCLCQDRWHRPGG